MFKFKYVENHNTGKRYWICKAELTNEEGPDKEGADWYEIDLQSVNLDEEAIIGLDLIDYHDGEIHITDGLDPNHRIVPTGEPGHYRTITTALEVQGDTLILPKGHQLMNFNLWKPCEADRMGIVQELWGDYIVRLHGMLKDGCMDTDWEGDACMLLDAAIYAPLEEYKTEIQEELVRLYHEKGEGNMSTDDPERIELYQRVLGINRRV